MVAEKDKLNTVFRKTFVMTKLGVIRRIPYLNLSASQGNSLCLMHEFLMIPKYPALVCQADSKQTIHTWIKLAYHVRTIFAKFLIYLFSINLDFASLGNMTQCRYLNEAKPVQYFVSMLVNIFRISFICISFAYDLFLYTVHFCFR